MPDVSLLTTRTPLGQSSPDCGTAASVGQTVADSAAATPATRDGDTVHFSAEARQLAAQADSAVSNTASAAVEQPQSAVIDASQVQGSAETTRITTATTQSGRTVAIDFYAYAAPATDVDGASVSQSGYMVTIGGNGDEADHRYLLTGSAIINEDANGTVHIGAYAPGQETSGDDIIVSTNLAASTMSGGDGNDTLIAFSSYGSSRVTGGAGDDTVLIAGDFTGSIDTGSGDDTLVATTIGFGGTATIDTGDGNDVIAADYIGVGGSVTINTGDGDDDIAASWLGVHGGQVTIDTGKGNDAIAASWIGVGGAQVNLKTGSGDDTIDASWIGVDSAQVNIDTGDGNDGIYATWIGVGGAQVNISGGSGGGGYNSGSLAMVNDDSDSAYASVCAGMVDAGIDPGGNLTLLDDLTQDMASQDAEATDHDTESTPATDAASGKDRSLQAHALQAYRTASLA